MNHSHRVPPSRGPLRLAPPALDASPAEATLDDAALIEAVVRGDAQGARHLHDRLVSAIERTLYRVLGKREPEHDDLVQATFEQIVLTLRRGRFARGCSLPTFASAIAAHVAFNALRARRSARRVFHPAELADVVEDPRMLDARMVGNAERDVGIRARIQLAQAHLTAMSPDKAIVLVLHDVVGHELAEIAAMLGVSVAAAQSRLVRARGEFLRRTRAEQGSIDEGGDHG